MEHVTSLIAQEGLIGAAAGSMFVFKGKYRAVLISYPSYEGKKKFLTGLTGLTGFTE